MGSIIIEGLVSSGVAAPGDVFVYEVDAARAKQVADRLGVKVSKSVKEISETCEMIFLCVKPDQFPAVAREIGEGIEKNKNACLVSIMAGVKNERIKKLVGVDIPVIRVMPNVACIVKKGVSGVAREDAASEEKNQFVHSLFAGLGGAVWVPESKMDAVTAVSGSGPAYVAMFIEAMTDAGVKIGLDRASAQDLAARTVAGSAAMLLETGCSTLDLRTQVSSPGGTTVAGTTMLEKRAFKGAVIEAVEAAWKRAVELGG